jgi:hypothetical protein
MSNEREKRRSTGSKGKLPIIRASEIGAYVYCRRAWWLRRVGGFEPQDPGGRFARGQEAHARHGRRLRQAELQRRVAFFLLVAGLLLLAVAFLFFR